jgi:hypothetical protein
MHNKYKKKKEKEREKRMPLCTGCTTPKVYSVILGAKKCFVMTQHNL